LLAKAGERGVTTLHADVLSDDVFLLSALGRIGPLSVSMQLDAVAVDIDIGGARTRLSERYPKDRHPRISGARFG
jgi:hypothetical protein